MDVKKIMKALHRINPMIQKYRAAILVLFAGILLLVIGSPKHNNSTEVSAEPPSISDTGGEILSFDLNAFEDELGETLSQIEGVGRVRLALSLGASEESVYASDIRQSLQSSQTTSYESTIAIVSDRDYGQAPILVKNVYPTFRGALVLCDGADSDVVRLAVTEAVSTMCGIGADQVSVLKMQG